MANRKSMRELERDMQIPFPCTKEELDRRLVVMRYYAYRVMQRDLLVVGAGYLALFIALPVALGLIAWRLA